MRTREDPQPAIWYAGRMTKLTQLIEQVKCLPAERQEDVQHVLEAMIDGGTETYRLSDEERTLVDEGRGSRTVSPTELREFRDRDPHAA